ncbi:MAG: reverse transcriptase/maturase family protein [Tateyamaria sp.]|uniref:reverse transcriptase domain-containing protein n=1 Tax=Tateyamaria sp. TaxID=1929288 RepID=UPI00329D84A7
MLIELMASDDILDEAYAWLCHRRRDYPANADIWWFRRNWASENSKLQRRLLTRTYRFDALDRVTLKDGSTVDVWTSRDALVLKALTLCLSDVLPASSSCTHIKGHGGAKEAVRQVAGHLPQHGYVLRTDVKSYYASIDHHLLLERLAEHIADQTVLNLLSQYMRRSICDGGNYIDIERGISLGCPLSPLMAAFYLHELDEQFERTNLFYVRFMDDILILAPTRWKVRKAMAVVRSMLTRLRLDIHPDKTFIGRIATGFDFLGYHFLGGMLSAAEQTVAKMTETAARLYEQKRRGQNSASLGQYLTRWNGWFRGGLGGLNLCFPLLPHPKPGETGKTRQENR